MVRPDMDFLVFITNGYPLDGDPARKAALDGAERARAAELAAQRTLVRLWRRPGRRANVGLWRAPDATELHVALVSLPYFPWLEIDVWPLADHPNDPSGGTPS